MYKLMSTVTHSGGRNINMSHFISYVFTEDEIIILDDKTLQERLTKTYQLTSSSKRRYVQ